MEDKPGKSPIEQGDYKPATSTTILMLLSLFVFVLPAIIGSALGYMWLVEHGFKLNLDAGPETLADSLVILGLLLPMIPVMTGSILLAGIPWMYLMARLLSWRDIEFYTHQKQPRLPVISDWLDAIWNRMIATRPEARNSGCTLPPDKR